MKKNPSQIAKAVLRIKGKAVEIRPEFRIYYKATVIKRVWYGARVRARTHTHTHTHTHTQNRNIDHLNRTESPELKPHPVAN